MSSQEKFCLSGQAKKIKYTIKLCNLGTSKCHAILKDLRTSKGNVEVKGTQHYNASEVIYRQEFCTASVV